MTNDITINVSGDLTKPASDLIKVVKEAVGGIFEPWQKVRIAKAEAKAERIKTLAKIKTSQIGYRAITRFWNEEIQKQKNIESITAKSLLLLEKEAKPKQIEKDWLVNFFDKSRIISDEEMQNIWAKILAGEANAPGKFSRRTINFMASLDKRDAEAFTNLCNFNWNLGIPTPLIYSYTNEIYTKNGVTFGNIQHLDSIGLINFASLTGYVNTNLHKKITAIYRDTPFILEFPKESGNELKIGEVILTIIGMELESICVTKEIKGFKEYVLKQWGKDGIKVSSPYNMTKMPPAA